jgi:hypothetical protein
MGSARASPQKAGTRTIGFERPRTIGFCVPERVVRYDNIVTVPVCALGRLLGLPASRPGTGTHSSHFGAFDLE